MKDMSKKRIESLKSVRGRINKNASKAVKRELKQSDFDKLLKVCQRQNEVIDLHAFADKSMLDAAKALVNAKLCFDEQSALRRIKRHKHVDIESFINARLARLFERANVTIQDTDQNSVSVISE